MTADDHREDAQLHYAAAHAYLGMARDARENDTPGGSFFASLASAYATLAQLELVAYAQQKNGVPREERIDRYHPRSPIVKEARGA